MKWDRAVLKKVSVTEKDRLGNSIKTYGKIKNINVRATQWTADDVNLYGRDLTKNTRKLITTYKDIEEDMIIELEGIDYKIRTIQKLSRFIFMIVERFETWQ